MVRPGQLAAAIATLKPVIRAFLIVTFLRPSRRRPKPLKESGAAPLGEPLSVDPSANSTVTSSAVMWMTPSLLGSGITASGAITMRQDLSIAVSSAVIVIVGGVGGWARIRAAAMGASMGDGTGGDAVLDGAEGEENASG